MITKAEAWKEIKVSRDILLEELGKDSASTIASPMGNYNAEHLKMFKDAGYIAHVRGWGGELGEVNDASEDGLTPFELVRYDWKNYHTAEDICNEVLKAEGKPACDLRESFRSTAQVRARSAEAPLQDLPGNPWASAATSSCARKRVR